MTREQYASLPLSELKEIAKARGLKGTSVMKKGDLIQLMLEKDEESRAESAPEKAERTERAERTDRFERPAERVPERPVTQDMSQLDSGQVANGILEVLACLRLLLSAGVLTYFITSASAPLLSLVRYTQPMGWASAQ